MRQVGFWVRAAIGLCVAVAVWWIVVETVLPDVPRLYPTPPDVWQELLVILRGESPIGSTYDHALATLRRFATAFLIGYVVGTALGVVAGRNPRVFDFSTTFIWIGLGVPSVVWVFIFLLVFGISELVPVLALALALTCPVFLGTAEGVKAIPSELLEMSRSYHVPFRQRLFHLYLPSIFPYMLANARVASAYGIKVVIIAEVVGLDNGVGQLVAYWADTLYLAPLIAWGLIMVLFGVVMDRIFWGSLERRWADRQTSRSK